MSINNSAQYEEVYPIGKCTECGIETIHPTVRLCRKHTKEDSRYKKWKYKNKYMDPEELIAYIESTTEEERD